MRSGKYRTSGEYWAKPENGTFAEQCKWCFDNLGNPATWFTNIPGRWKTKSHYGIFVFGNKEDRDTFRAAWNKRRLS